MRLLWLFLLIYPTAILVFGSEPTVWIARFSQHDAQGTLEEWESWEFPNVPRSTRYSLFEDDGITVLKAESNSAASALMIPTQVNASSYPWLAWSWKTDGPVLTKDWSVESDDYPLRLFVIFEQESGPFGFFKRAVGGFQGRALNYVWVPELTGTSHASPSPVTDRVQMIPIRQGSGSFGAWTSEKRNVLEDYHRVFGEKPGRIIGVAVMTDTDGTNSTCTSYFGDIGFLSQ
jgi:hypothetical protein